MVASGWGGQGRAGFRKGDISMVREGPSPRGGGQSAHRRVSDRRQRQEGTKREPP